MREVNLAKSAGFCFGVKRAVDMVYQSVEQGDSSVCTLGPIIHNEQVVQDLEKKGVQVISSPKDADKDSTVVIRSHGINKKEENELKSTGCQIIDATCPFVKKIHNTVHKYSMEGRKIVVVGDPKHPEVQGIVGWSVNGATVIESLDEAEKLSFEQEEKLCIVAQTTYNYKKFEDLVVIIRKKGYDIIAVNTICNATEVRQKEASELASCSDAMIVIGGRNSSNSQKLYEICKNLCASTFFIQTVEDLSLEKLSSFQSLGITAGASTPNTIIQEVLLACRK